MPKEALKGARAFYAEELRAIAGITGGSAVIRAFAKIQREKFLGPGPWTVRSLLGSYRTPNKNPRWLYHDVLVSLNAAKGINNGSPAFWAFLFSHLDVKPGDRILQVGAGSGYYAAILAELVGRSGRVHAVEFDGRLARRAKTNLAPWPHVNIILGDASVVDVGEIDIVVAFAGGTHPARIWLEWLAPFGRLLMPLVTDSGGGFILKAVRRRKGFAAKALSPCGFILAEGFRNKKEAVALKKALAACKGKSPTLDSLHIGQLPLSQRSRAFFSGQSFWLSKAEA